MRGAAQGLIGRNREHERLAAVLESASRGAGSCAMVEGEPGIGKTALLTDALETARTLGFTIFHAAAEELARDRPFGVMSAALGRIDVKRADDDEARLRIVDRILDEVETRAASSPVIVAIDDAHWADSSSTLALRALVRATPPMRVAVIVARRHFPATADLESLALDIRDASGLCLTVEPLHGDEVTALAERILGTRPEGTLVEAVSRAGGNPLFVQELLAAMREEGSITVEGTSASAVSSSLPVSLRLAILRRIAFLPAVTVELLRVSSVLGSSFAPADLAAVLGRRPSDLLADLRPAVASGFLVDRESTLSFRHDVIREAVYEDLGAVRRALHLQAARALAAAGAPNTRVATQFALGAEPGDEEAVARLRQAAADAGGRAPAIAVRLLRHALELAPASRRTGIVPDLIHWLTWSGDIEEARRLAEESLVLVDDATAARFKISAAKALVLSGRPAESLAQVEKALAIPGLPAPVRAEILAEIALRRCHFLDGDGVRQAAGAALATGDTTPSIMASAWIALGFADASEGRVVQGIERVRKAVETAGSDPTERGQLDGPLGYLGMVLHEGDRLAEAAAAFGEARLDIERRGMLWNLPVRLALTSTLRFSQGEWDEAAVDAESALTLSDETAIRAMILIPASVLARIATHRGDLEQAGSVLQRAFEEIGRSGPGRLGIVSLLTAHAELLDASGRCEEGRELLLGTLRLCVHLDALGAARDLLLPLARLAIGEPADLRELSSAAVELAARAGLPSLAATAALVEALAAGTVERAARAAEHDFARPIESAHALEAAAAAAGATGNPAEAERLGTRAIAAYERLGATSPVARIERMLRACGVRLGARGRRTRAAVGWDSLTPGEHRVLDLAAQGLTNPAIAARLYVSRATVATHLSHIFTKLGISSRVELAAITAARDDRGHRGEEL